MQKKNRIKGTLYIAGYVLFSVIPLIVILTTTQKTGADFWVELSVGLAYCGFAIVGLQFLLTARLGWLHEPYGSDIVYYFHHKISALAYILIFAHPVILLVFRFDWYGAMLDLSAIPFRVLMGMAGLLLLTLLVVAAVYRKQLKIEYLFWRIMHGLAAITIVVVSVVHFLTSGTYIQQPLKKALWIAYGVVWIALLLWARIIKPILIARRPWEVVEAHPERGSITSLKLKPMGNYEMRFKPGQFAWVYIRSKPGQAREHPFSFTASAENPREISFGIKALGDFTSTIKDVKVGEKVFLEGPYGSFSADNHPHVLEYVFIAGGAGITPVLSHLRTFAERGEKRRLTLINANKEWDGVAFREELDDLKSRLNLQIVHVIEKPSPDWTGENGFLNAQILEKYLPKQRGAQDLRVFICGPIPMMNAAEKALLSSGVPGQCIVSERFDLV